PTPYGLTAAPFWSSPGVRAKPTAATRAPIANAHAAHHHRAVTGLPVGKSRNTEAIPAVGSTQTHALIHAETSPPARGGRATESAYSEYSWTSSWNAATSASARKIQPIGFRRWRAATIAPTEPNATL